MRTRQEIKHLAKQAFAAQRGHSILALFLPMLIAFGFSAIVSIITLLFQNQLMNPNPDPSVLIGIVVFSLIIWLLSMAFAIIMLVIEVNIAGTFVKVFCGRQISPTEPFEAIKPNFGRKLGGMLWMSLWLCLWSIIGPITLFIPFIIKTLSYSMTPYILADNPNVTATEALKLSKRITKGHKGKIFVMALSFIGWNILSGLTLGILGILYVYPYMYTSFAGLFVQLRSLAVATGVVHQAELDGAYLHNQ